MSDEPLLYPRWRQAVVEFLAEFKYGDLVAHEWLESRFGMPTLHETKLLTREQFRDRQFDWLANLDSFKAELLESHQVCLKSVRGQGYRWLSPADQTQFAAKEFEQDARRVFRLAGQRLRNVRFAELSDEDRRQNTDAAAKLSALAGMQHRIG